MNEGRFPRPWRLRSLLSHHRGAFHIQIIEAEKASLDHSEARVVGGQVLVDANGDGIVDITITLSGLTNANQLTVDDFLFV